ncbi:MAG TPA: hypothetical protein VMY77_03805 [Chitinophagaceae bacterium]|nr:hypothetical protein [Chitinophagaceae bacterium]
MTYDLEEFEAQPAQRPTFLKVLCILTFIGSSYAIISSTITYFNADMFSKKIVETKSEINRDVQHQRKSTPESNAFKSKMMNNMAVMTEPGNLRKSSIGTIISSVFCLIGAILMWRLNRKGFYIYVVGTIIGIAVPLYVFGNNLITALSVGIGALIGILFVIFYAMNLKSMK